MTTYPSIRKTIVGGLLAAVTIVSAACTLAYAGRTWLMSRTSATQQEAVPAQNRLEAELITITPKGFDPPEIRRPMGRFFLLVENRSGASELNLQLNRVAGNKLNEIRLPKGRLSWRPLVDLTPGQYVLTESGRPNWRCNFTITAR